MIAIQIASFVIYVIILLCYIIPKKISFSDNSYFYGVLICIGFSILFDCLSTYFAYKNTLEFQVLVIIYKVFFISLVGSAFFILAYLLSKSILSKKIYSVLGYSMIAPVINAILIAMLSLDIEIVQNGLSKGLEITGPSIDCTYACAFVYLFFIICLLVLRSKKLNRWHFVCFVSSAVTISICTVIQLFSNQTGWLSLAFAISLFVIFAFVENPLIYLNHKFYCFKSNFIRNYVDRICTIKDCAFIIYLDINDCDKASLVLDRSIALKKKIVREFRKYRDCYVFVSETDELFIVCNDLDQYDFFKKSLKDEIEEFYSKCDFKESFKANCLSIENAVLFDNSDELLSCIYVERENVSKSLGHNNWYEIDEDVVISIKSDEMRKATIQKAIDEDRIEAFVQPIYSVEEKKIVKAEALCRIRNLDGTYLLPYQFIPLSEKCGLDIPIGYRMIEKICKCLSTPDTKDLFKSIDINLSIAQCEQEDMANSIIEITKKYNIAPLKLNFEITETGFMNKRANIERNIKILTDYGFGFSLDDFGNGESNLDYLVQLPVSYIKIDMHMIWAYFENKKADKTVKAIIKISHDLGLEVIAEGVETKEQLDELCAQGVDYIQGFYFYKPMPINDYVDIVNRNK